MRSESLPWGWGGWALPAKRGVRGGVQTARFGASFGQPGELEAAFLETEILLFAFRWAFQRGSNGSDYCITAFCIGQIKFSCGTLVELHLDCPKLTTAMERGRQVPLAPYAFTPGGNIFCFG